MLTRRALLGGIAGAAAAQRRRRPNLLFLLADDHAGYVLGAAGDQRAETPNLDRLAGEGTRFARHHTNSPVCTPSRQSFFTGQMPHMAGVTVLRTPLAEDKPTLARQLQAAGYATGVIGKMHFNRPSRPGLHGFDWLMTEQDVQQAWSAGKPAREVAADIPTKPPWRPFRDPARIWLNAEKLPFPRYYDDMKGSWIARRAVRYLEEHSNRSFALWVSFHEPHSPFDFPIDDRERYEPGRFPVPRVGAQDAWQIPLIFRELGEQEKQGIIAAYYTSVWFLDRNVGVVLDALGRLKLDQDTLVIYMADHGYSLGHHGRFEKHCGYEPALHVPLILRLAGRIRRGVVREMTEHIDVPATLVDLLDVDPLPVLHGRSLRPYLEGRRAEARDHIVSEYLENEEAFVRSARYKLIFGSGRRSRQDGYQTDNPTPGRYVRLFDLEEDPGEFSNVASRRPQVVAELEGLLLDRFRRTHPEAEREPQRLSREEALEWYVRPRDA